ncbi:DUF4255 domain-containing protein [Erythrobacter litoralis]|uniref:Pvc16 N-terminal domain-containing protein n=1 Tax=Erythrobacter litoralis (strain HTCC2594) TaxID=314225 RepID=Q2N8P4_ERYLH|nr:DUF4255 domain-containing protein [Erythrobacter litoralis]ABC63947.1 hypothetical protein ELI_09275 [Erythrobacter litoralis HTCC2594]
MAQYQAIAATSAALKALIEERYPRAEFGGTLNVDSRHVADLEEDQTDDGFAIVLWRVTINKELRARAPRTDVFGNRFKPSLPLDLHFLVIPFARSVERQHRMLGWVMRMFADVGHISAAQLNAYLAEDDIFPATEDVELVADPLPLADHLTVWERLKNFPAYASYQLRMVLIDSTVSMTENPPVVEREFEYGAITPPAGGSAS